MMDGKTVFLYRSSHHAYPERAPFAPSSDYPEVAFPTDGSQPNPVYEAIRDCFRMAGLDGHNYGSVTWNPLGALLRPGETVLLKPNLIKEIHPRDPEGWRYVVTHGSVIRAVADYVWKAIGPAGVVVLADAPQTDSSFSTLVSKLGLDVVQGFYSDQGLRLELLDLRREEWENQDGVITRRHSLAGDPHGEVAFDLGESSEFHGHSGSGRYYGADYDAGVVNRHHSDGRHEYLLAGSAVKCDAVISLPKLKTHKKAGITVSLKNLVGVNADKNWLPHHTEGHPDDGGDEHPNPGTKHKLERLAAAQLRRLSLRLPVLGTWLHRHSRHVGRGIFGDTEVVIRSGNWWGNETVWRMCLDLNKLVLYGNADGTLRPPSPENRKRHYVLVDGLHAGEGRGPMNPDPVAAGVLFFGVNAPSVDAVAAYLMGFDPDRIPIVSRAFSCREFPLVDWGWRDVSVVSNVEDWNGPLTDIADDATFNFEPHFGWKGHIERQAQAKTAQWA